jgi:hypothetical protein
LTEVDQGESARVKVPEPSANGFGRRRGLACGLLGASSSALTWLQMLAAGTRDLLKYKLGRDYEYAPRPDDVFVVTYPKSGTTLTQMLLYQMTTRGEMDFPHIDSVCPWFEMEILMGHPRQLEVPSPRIFKSHYLWEQLPRGGRFVYVVRDVRDVALSAYHHECMIGAVDFDLGEYLDRFLAGQARFGSWFRHLESWWPHRNDPNVLFLRYEEVVADLPAAVRRLAGFLGFEVREEDMPRIAERSGFRFMKEHGRKFDPRLRRTSQSPREFIRRGQVGEGAAVWSPEQRDRLAGRLAALERKVGMPAGSPEGRG